MSDKVTITKRQRDNLLLLAKAVREDALPFPIGMMTFIMDPGIGCSPLIRPARKHPCGTTACLVGNAAEMPEFEEYRKKALRARETYGQFSELAFGELDNIHIGGATAAGEIAKSHGVDFDEYDESEVWDALFDSDIQDDADHAARIEAVVEWLNQEGHVA